ncbi:MAG TPA: ISNCY family transposase, partial [Pantoea sp.]|nr:ISNCY family transposase [Pantoea sp.]
GLEQGRQLGEREASLNIARNLLKNGMDVPSVMKVTGLSEEDLQQIRH